MNEFNPYAAPEAPLAPTRRPAPQPGELYRDGRSLVFTKKSALPDRCLLCNAPAGGYRLHQTLYWHHPLYYLPLLFLLIPGFLIYMLVALFVRQTARVAVPLCVRHRRRRWAAIGLMFAGVSSGSNAIGIPGLILLPVCLVAGVVFAQVAVPKRIDAHFVWLGKVAPEFLADLPEWHQR